MANSALEPMVRNAWYIGAWAHELKRSHRTHAVG